MDTALKDILEKPDEMGRPEKPVTPQDIKEFERSQGVALPDSLKSFWQKYGVTIWSGPRQMRNLC